VKHLRAFVLFLACLIATTPACLPPQPIPPSDGGVPAVTPSGWTRAAHLSATVGHGLIAVARPIVAAIAVDPGATRAARAFDAADDALTVLDHAATAYEARGGDACAAYAAAGAASIALRELTDVLADNGLAIGVPLGRVVDLVASLVDTLVPGCDRAVGWASAGASANGHLRDVEQAARLRGVILRRDLDAIAPALDGGVQ